MARQLTDKEYKAREKELQALEEKLDELTLLAKAAGLDRLVAYLVNEGQAEFEAAEYRWGCGEAWE